MATTLGNDDAMRRASKSTLLPTRRNGSLSVAVATKKEREITATPAIGTNHKVPKTSILSVDPMAE